MDPLFPTCGPGVGVPCTGHGLVPEPNSVLGRVVATIPGRRRSPARAAAMGTHAVAAGEDGPGRRDLLRIAAERVAEMRPAAVGGLPVQDRLPRGGAVYALVVQDSNGQPAEAVVAFPTAGAADLYARHKAQITDWRVVPVRFLTSRPRAGT